MGVTANRGFHLLSMLKENPEDVELQNEYRDIIGDVDWEESKVFLETGEDNPRFVLRRAFNYLNPIAGIVGQFVYRVIACRGPALNNGACNEGEILYTITKDRIGKGFLWGKDEYRVYTGTGGCKRSGHGVLSCHQSDQVMYSLSAGIKDGTHDTQYYKGNIVEIYGDGKSGVVHEQLHKVTDGTISQVDQFTETEVDFATLEGMKVAHISKVAGPPRWLNWPVMHVVPATWSIFNLARSLVWVDAYQMDFVGGGDPVDDLLISLMAAAQDLTRDYKGADGR